MRLFHLDGRVAVVTGAVGRLGPTWVRGLLEAGASVVGLDLPDAQRSPSWSGLMEKYGSSRVFLRDADVRDRESLEAALMACREAVGEPDILVNNAGIDQPPAVTQTSRLEDISGAALTTVFDVNVIGAFLAAQVFGSAMVSRGSGSIVNIGSLYASVSPDPRFYDHLPLDPPFLKPPAYGASKAALVNLSRYLATHWGPYGVRVNVLSPGGVLGDQDPTFVDKFSARVPLGRLVSPEELIGPLLFLASDASSYVTGADLIVDGGFSAW